MNICRDIFSLKKSLNVGEKWRKVMKFTKGCCHFFCTVYCFSLKKLYYIFELSVLFPKTKLILALDIFVFSLMVGTYNAERKGFFDRAVHDKE